MRNKSIIMEGDADTEAQHSSGAPENIRVGDVFAFAELDLTRRVLRPRTISPTFWKGTLTSKARTITKPTTRPSTPSCA